MLDAALLQPLRSELEADGYRMDATESGGRIAIRITASGQACPECLVPREMMRAVLGHALGVAEDLIDLTYPADPPG